MRPVINYIRQYIREVDKRIILFVSCWAAILIFLNYYFGIDDRISNYHSFSASFIYRYFIFLFAFALPYMFYLLVKGKNHFNNPVFIFLLLLAPAIFSMKIALNIPLHFSNEANWNDYWNHIAYWPVLLLIITAILLVIWKTLYSGESFFGITFKNFHWKPYLLMLLIMLPLITLASTQADFLDMYPKLKLLSAIYGEKNLGWWHKLLFEFSYGSDFITIELFFRGFLILAFIKWVGKDAILPMACFYCTIHFGKPLGECISSYFGGMILGIIVYNTRSIFGGLMVHLGIAWMMEIGGYIGNALH
ncbi:MAG TPA: CPBP family glutamic-type intramembrane protease [Chitinophagaceae bacterium]|nr:CPBP family glutamic-type intramembrane protease [Chitinophagaceae bacterium]